MRIIPAIDILNGKCVRLTQGDFTTGKVYNENPSKVAQELEDNGIKYLHLVDLDGARSGSVVNYSILEEIASSTKLKIDFGGGIRSDSDLTKAFSSGAWQITVGSIALSSPLLVADWIKTYGNERIILGADSKGGKIASEGWRKESEQDTLTWISDYYRQGIRYVICTDIEKDGMLKGPAKELYRSILDKVPVKLIASGGISTLGDISDLEELGCEGVIIGKAIYEGNIKIKELRDLC
jgi:phosphoribosylformimino-5-aminoimidazole carboxamide ribotide isomerase